LSASEIQVQRLRSPKLPSSSLALVPLDETQSYREIGIAGNVVSMCTCSGNTTMASMPNGWQTQSIDQPIDLAA
jgi:hypothetical protein